MGNNKRHEIKFLFVAGTFFVCLLFSSAVPTERRFHKCFNSGLVVNYQTLNGLMDGDYSSFYKNGKVKCEGRFLNNMRVGVWTVYDSLGNKKIQRDYKNNFEFKQVFPTVPTNAAIDLLNQPTYKLTYNKKGFIEYSYLQERAVTISKRIWRTIEPQNNPELFANNKLIQALVDSVAAGKLRAFGNQTDEFRDTITKQNLERLLDTAHYDVVGYDIKEDWFFDNERMLSETRVIGISPILQNRQTLEKQDLFQYRVCWFYFPQIRSLLANIKVKDKSCPKYIHTLDDVFFFRYFYGQITKESNIFNRRISDYTKTPDQQMDESERIDIGMIESEHDVWLSFSK